jgi:hypothetical protein
LGTEIIGLDFAELRTHLKASLFEVEFNERVDKGVESFVNSAVLVNSKEIERTV